MPLGAVACDYFLHLRLGWFVSAIDSCGHLGGTLVAWNPHLDDFKDFETCAGILLIWKLKGLDTPLHILNIYRPYSKKRYFWDRLKSSSLLSLPSLILAGDLNFT